ncbi:MAG: hypothetical protein U1C58_11325, partial [Flavobacteriaceae bacterium]|nr:hypothetical protein [Flavobacteriaceae bacterium]
SQTTVTSSKTYSDGTTEYSSRTTGIDCVSFNETGTIKTATNSFEECPECTEPADGGIGILPPKGTTEEVVNEEEQIVNNLTNPCASDIFDELWKSITREGTIKPNIILPTGELITFSDAVLKIFNDSKTFDYIVTNDNLLKENAITNSKGIDKIVVLTTMSNSYLQSATTLSIARTMIHELTHAYFLFKTRELDFTIAINLFAVQNGYNTSDTNRLHHEFMRDYINAIAFSLYNWDRKFGTGGNLGWDYYKAMAYGGLFQMDQLGNITNETDAFKSLIIDESERKKTAKILFNEQKSIQTKINDEIKNEFKGIPCK